MTATVSRLRTDDRDQINDLGRTRLRWTACFVLMTTLFAGAAWLTIDWSPAMTPPPAPPPAAVMIDLAPLPAAPTSETATLPAPQHTLSQSPPEAAVRPMATPPPPLVAAPEVALPLPVTPPLPRPPVEHRHRIHVPKLTAPPMDRTPPAPAVTAPAEPAAFRAPTPLRAATPAAPTSPSNAVPTWQGELLAQLKQFKRYPQEAQVRREQGVAYLRFTMDRDGRVLSARIEKTSSHDLLDQETLALIQRAQPLPKPPASVPGDRIDLIVPIDFFLRAPFKTCPAAC